MHILAATSACIYSFHCLNVPKGSAKNSELGFQTEDLLSAAAATTGSNADQEAMGVCKAPRATAILLFPKFSQNADNKPTRRKLQIKMMCFLVGEACGVPVFL